MMQITTAQACRWTNLVIGVSHGARAHTLPAVSRASSKYIGKVKSVLCHLNS